MSPMPFTSGLIVWCSTITRLSWNPCESFVARFTSTRGRRTRLAVVIKTAAPRSTRAPSPGLETRVPSWSWDNLLVEGWGSCESASRAREWLQDAEVVQATADHGRADAKRRETERDDGDLPLAAALIRLQARGRLGRHERRGLLRRNSALASASLGLDAP